MTNPTAQWRRETLTAGHSAKSGDVDLTVATGYSDGNHNDEDRLVLLAAASRHFHKEQPVRSIIFDGQDIQIADDVELSKPGPDWGGQLVLLGFPAAGTEMNIPLDRMYLDRSILGCRYGSSRPTAGIPRYVDLYRSDQLLLDELMIRTDPLADFRRLFDDARPAALDRGVLEFAS